METDFDYKELIMQTDKACLLSFEEYDEDWFPKSICIIDTEINVISVPDWMAKEKGML